MAEVRREGHCALATHPDSRKKKGGANGGEKDWIWLRKWDWTKT